jgi:O-antigen ligase
MAHSATAFGCFLLGGGLLLATNMRVIRNRPLRVRALCFAVVLAGGLTMLFGGQSLLSNALGRGSGLSGRAEIWAASVASAGNPLIGTGFESFWNANANKVNEFLHSKGFIDQSNLVSAHNGYLEIYLDLGLIGVCLIVPILLSGYRNASKAFRHDPEVGSLMLAYVTTATFYSITEAGFRVLTPMWIFLLLAVITASALAAGLLDGRRANILAPRGSAASRTLAAGNQLTPQGEAVYTARGGVIDAGRNQEIGLSETALQTWLGKREPIGPG